MEEVKIHSNIEDVRAVDYKSGETIAVGDIIMYGSTGWLPAATLAVDELLNLGKVGMAVAPSDDLSIPLGAARSAQRETASPPTAVSWGKGAVILFTAEFEVSNLPAAKFSGTASKGDQLTLDTNGLFKALSNATDNAVCVAIAMEDIDASGAGPFKISSAGAGYTVPKVV